MQKIVTKFSYRSYIISSIIFFSALFCMVPSTGLSQEKKVPLPIAIHECPPFVIKDDKSEKGYSGLSIYLLDQVAQKNNFDYWLKEYSLQGMLDAVRDGKAAAGVSCTSITPEREMYLDFSHSFFETNLAIATHQVSPLTNLLNIFLNKKFLQVLGIIFAISTLISIFLWFFEHKVNDKLYIAQHGFNKVIEALIPGLLCVTKGPPSYWNLQTMPGRLLVVVGAISSTFIVAGVTAMIASVLTTQQLKGRINGPQDLHNIRVGVTKKSTSAQYLNKIEVVYTEYDTKKAMLIDLEAKKLDAVVSDAPVLRYLLKKGHQENQFQGIIVLPAVFEKQNYGMVLPENHHRQEELNRSLLEVRREPGWKAIQDHYFKEIQ
ncbi:MAG: transporter substrate-binding domain-containing protein [Thermodesulfobacteriota bacterium]|nr:transporter substrate-binding domain-containing protein [Thermodesulfobacteriota bacterium]